LLSLLAAALIAGFFYAYPVSVMPVITGQMLASVALDVFGLLGVVAKPLSFGDVLGTLAVVGGAATIVRGQETRDGAADAPRRAPRRLRWVILAVIGGTVLLIQGAVNALFRGDLQSPVAAALVSFAVATAAMAVLLVPIIRLGNETKPNLGALARVPWWGWLGGVCGVISMTPVFERRRARIPPRRVADTDLGTPARSMRNEFAVCHLVPAHPA
jgi:transporter family-2 protein